MQSLDIVLKGIKAVCIYDMLREGVPKSNGTWEKRIQVVLLHGMLFSSNCVYMNKICFCWYTH